MVHFFELQSASILELVFGSFHFNSLGPPPLQSRFVRTESALSSAYLSRASFLAFPALFLALKSVETEIVKKSALCFCGDIRAKIKHGVI